MERDELLAFGTFTLDTRARLLLQAGVPVPLPPKSYETLVYLVRNRGRAVSREELAGGVWPDVVVGDGSLSQAVFVLRKALGESEDGPRFIETVPRVGYRFSGNVDPVAEVGQAAEPPPAAAAPRAPRRVLPAAVLVVLLAAGAGGFFLARRQRPVQTPGTADAGRLLSIVRELAVAPDATRLLGHVETSSILAAPGAYYIVPDDGAAPTRIPLREGETPIAVWEDSLALTRGDEVVLRNPLTQATVSVLKLPSPRTASRRTWTSSRDGRFLARGLDDGIEVLERRDDRFASAFHLPIRPRPNERLAMSARYLAVAEGDGAPLRVFSLPDGRPVLEAPFAELRVSSLAIDDGGGRVAAGGPFDEIDVFTIGANEAPVRIPRRGWTHGMAFVPDAPTLVASGYYGTVAFRGAASVDEETGTAAEGAEILPFSGGVLVYAPDRHRLTWLSYSGAAPATRVPASAAVLWTLEHDASGKHIFAGGRDGRLYALDVSSSRLSSETVHTDGIPSLVRDGDLLASASDDKTVAVWRLPGPTLVRRETAHRFLVNDLQIAPGAPGGAALVTSSSDGAIKVWAWPTLEPRETIDAAALTGRQSELHALWTAPDLSRILAGTWDGALLDIRRTGGGWKARRLSVGSSVVYRLASLPGAGLVAGVGHSPPAVFVFDLESGSIHPIGTSGLDAFWAVADPQSDELYVVGHGGLSRYTFERANGRVRYRLVTRRQGGLFLTAATLLPDGTLWAGTEDGALVSYARSTFDGPGGTTGGSPSTASRLADARPKPPGRT